MSNNPATWDEAEWIRRLRLFAETAPEETFNPMDVLDLVGTGHFTIEETGFLVPTDETGRMMIDTFESDTDTLIRDLLQ